MSGIIEKLFQRRIQIKKDFLIFVFYRGLKFCVNTAYLFTFNAIFLQIKIFSIKNSISNLISCQKMNQFCVSIRLKALKRLVLVS